MKKISRKFYCAHSVDVARKLLGQIMCAMQPDGTILRGKIVETEAYRQEEESCHAYCGVTKRSKTLFEREGTLYVYFTYGMYHCSNIVTERKGYGSAVLIRAIEPLWQCDDARVAAGPAKLCRVLGLTREHNEIDTCSKDALVWFERGEDIDDSDVVQTVRIGIKKAVDLPWRFYVKTSKSVSKKDRALL